MEAKPQFEVTNLSVKSQMVKIKYSPPLVTPLPPPPPLLFTYVDNVYFPYSQVLEDLWPQLCEFLVHSQLLLSSQHMWIRTYYL